MSEIPGAVSERGEYSDSLDGSQEEAEDSRCASTDNPTTEQRVAGVVSVTHSWEEVVDSLQCISGCAGRWRLVTVVLTAQTIEHL